MIGKVIGAIAGAQAAKYSRNIGGTGGAILGAVAVPVLSRLRILPLLALGGGAYAAKKLIDKQRPATSTPKDSTAGI